MQHILDFKKMYYVYVHVICFTSKVAWWCPTSKHTNIPEVKCMDNCHRWDDKDYRHINSSQVFFLNKEQHFFRSLALHNCR